MKRILLTIATIFSLLLLAEAPAVGAVRTLSTPAATTAASSHINVTLAEMSIRTAAVTRAGAVTFSVTNTGMVTHELVVIRTDLGEGQLPPGLEAGKVSETGSLGESGDLAAGASVDFTLTLAPGHYVLICNEPGHYTAGMHTSLTVVSYVGVMLNEMTIATDSPSVPAGLVAFGVQNAGTVTHELVVIRTDTAFDKLPPGDEAGKVSETGSQGESGDIAAGRWSSFLLTLAPGKYVLICNEPGHYTAGMRLAFTVK